MIKKVLIYILVILKKASNDDIFSISAQFSYYIILSAFPFLFLLTSIMGYYSSSIYELIELVKSVLPENIYNIILKMTSSSISSYRKSYISASIIAIIFSASSGSAGIIKGINKAYDCQVKRSFIKTRINGLIFTFALIFALQLSFIFIIAGRRLVNFLTSLNLVTQFYILFINISRYFFPITYFILVFSLAYKFLLLDKQKFTSVLPGAIFSAFGWIAGSIIFSFYSESRISFYSSIYGNLSGFFTLLLWIYLSSFIFLMGAEINSSLLKSNIINKKIKKL